MNIRRYIDRRIALEICRYLDAEPDYLALARRNLKEMLPGLKSEELHNWVSNLILRLNQASKFASDILVPKQVHAAIRKIKEVLEELVAERRNQGKLSVLSISGKPNQLAVPGKPSRPTTYEYKNTADFQRITEVINNLQDAAEQIVRNYKKAKDKEERKEARKSAIAVPKQKRGSRKSSEGPKTKAQQIKEFHNSVKRTPEEQEKINAVKAHAKPVRTRKKQEEVPRPEPVMTSNVILPSQKKYEPPKKNPDDKSGKKSSYTPPAGLVRNHRKK